MRSMRGAATALGLFALIVAPMARAQTTTGAIQGTVTDQATGAPAVLVTVVAASPKLQGQASTLTDASGQYFLSNLPPGTYSLVFLYGDADVRRDNVEVGVGKTITVNGRINPQVTNVVTIKQRAPAIDAASTKQGVTLRSDYLKNVPGGRTSYDAVIDAAAGSQGDLFGTSFSGSTSVENSYIIDGVNTTGVRFAGVQSPLLNNFIEEIEVITGGYNAEFGRSTGAVVNVVTKTGSNEFHGSAWLNVTPFEVKPESVQSASSAFREERALDSELDFGFDVGGPIVKDKLWFYLGFAPSISRRKVTRVVSTNVDRNVRDFDYQSPNCTKNADGVTCDGDGNPSTVPTPGCELLAANGAACESDGDPDRDAANDPLFEEIDRSNQSESGTGYQFTGKLSFAVSPDHQGQLSFIGTPKYARGPTCVAGTPSACSAVVRAFTGDAALKWTSKLNNNKTQIDAVFGWHQLRLSVRELVPRLPNNPDRLTREEPRVEITNGDVNGTAIAIGKNWDTNESNEVLTFCRDEDVGSVSVDPFPLIPNCPFDGYALGGPGDIPDERESRFTGKLTLTQRFQAFGQHSVKVGADLEVNEVSETFKFSGGRLFDFNFTRDGDRAWRVFEYARPDPNGTDVCGFTNPDGQPIFCTLMRDGVQVDAQTLNWGAFVQDSWSIVPNLTINAGLRYEEQRIGYAKQVQNTIDPLTGEPVGSTGLKLSGLFAPRVGVIYDWTKEGRSKIYASWGRFYESVPMDVNLRWFGGLSAVIQRWRASDCGAFTPTDPSDPDRLRLPSLAENCPRSAKADGSVAPAATRRSGFGNPAAGEPAGVGIVAPGARAQAMDELVAGVEYEVLEDLRVGLSYQNRRMASVLEDVSTDGGQTYFLANPGEFDASEEQAMLDRINTLPTESELRSVLIHRLESFRRFRQFDRPVRDYNAIQLTGAKRFSRNFMVQGSYTYAVLEGNYEGLFQPDSGQLNPHTLLTFDLPELLDNGFGRLPGDRRHQIKLDGYYTFDLEKAGRITTGLRFRAQSGRPVEALSPPLRHILPRGSAGRTAFGATADLHVAYARRIHDVEVELYVQLFNVLNNQYETEKDNLFSSGLEARSIVGGDESDLPYLKSTSGAPVQRNLNWRNTTARAAPLSARIGVTLSF